MNVKQTVKRVRNAVQSTAAVALGLAQGFVDGIQGDLDSWLDATPPTREEELKAQCRSQKTDNDS